MSPALQQAALMAGEVLLTAGLLLVVFRLRSLFGLSLLFIALGVFQHLQVLLALSVYVEVLPGILISPGSAVLFTGTIFAFLLVYIREDAEEARKLIYGLVAANLVLCLFDLLVVLHLDSPLSHNFYDLPRELFLHNPRILLVGTLVLLLDGLLLIVVYEALSRHLTRHLFWRIFLTLLAVLAVDTVLFTVGSFWGQPEFGNLLVSGLLGKSVAALLYAIVLTAYIARFDLPDDRHQGPGLRDVFQLLTYRQRYEALRGEVTRDPLTGVRNRGFFDDVLPREIEVARRGGRPLTLLMIDVDRFKAFNDRHGHRQGDQVLRLVASVLTSALRTTDLVCRYGGDEFAVLLPDTGPARGVELAGRVRRSAAGAAAAPRRHPVAAPVTLTIGIATYPDDATTAADLVDVADRRLYEGKQGGRGAVVGRPRATRARAEPSTGAGAEADAGAGTAEGAG